MKANVFLQWRDGTAEHIASFADPLDAARFVSRARWEDWCTSNSDKPEMRLTIVSEDEDGPTLKSWAIKLDAP